MSTSIPWIIQMSIHTPFLSSGNFHVVAQLSPPKQSYKKALQDPRSIQTIPPVPRVGFHEGLG